MRASKTIPGTFQQQPCGQAEAPSNQALLETANPLPGDTFKPLHCHDEHVAQMTKHMLSSL
jgi:hypothetical protein